MECDRIGGSFTDGKRESIIYGFSLDEPPGHKKKVKTYRLNNIREV